ncbi:MAG: hypothetical protein N3B13_12080, partial [Deltaproteobacteria bacterium]|nr:hypothetical protein [Deltaproteobacteria bacterium]
MRRKSIILLVILSLALYLSLQVSCSSGDEKTKDVTQGDVTVGDVINLEDTKTEDSAGDTSLSDAGEETMPDAVSIDATPDAEDDGGAVKDEGSTTDVGTASFIYWEEGPNTLDTHAEGIAAYADGKIYLMAIFGSSQYKREVYNIAEKKWEPLANPPEGFNNDMSMRAGGVIGKNIHIVNGHYWFTPYTDHYVLNTETLEWSKKEAYPGEPVGKSCAAVYEGKLYVAGGEKQINSNTSVNKFYRYDPAAGKWEELAPMKNARSDFACAFVNGKFHVAGGYAEYKVPLSSHEIYD